MKMFVILSQALCEAKKVTLYTLGHCVHESYIPDSYLANW